MKSSAKWIMTLALLTGCSSSDPAPTVPKEDIQSVAYRYGENVFIQYNFLLWIHSELSVSTDSNNGFESLRMFVEGFGTGTKRRQIYSSAQNIVALSLKEHYDEQTINRLFAANERLTQLTGQLSAYVTSEHQTDAFRAQTLFELRERINDLQALLYPDHDDEYKIITLYTLHTNPKNILKKHTANEIDSFFTKLNIAMDQLEQVIEPHTK